MPLLDPEELDCMREAQAETLSQQAVIHRAVQTKVGGRPHTEYTPDAEPVACRFTAKGQREAQIGEQIQPVADGEIKLPWGTPITEHDQVQVEGQQFSIVGHDAERADATLLTLRVLRVGRPASIPIAQ